jgi:hypothetical protein
VREIKAGNWVLWFKLHEPVRIASDRTGKRKTLDEIKLNLHGRTRDATSPTLIGSNLVLPSAEGRLRWDGLFARASY